MVGVKRRWRAAVGGPVGSRALALGGIHKQDAAPGILQRRRAPLVRDWPAAQSALAIF
jgi:hypothetical protein